METIKSLDYLKIITALLCDVQHAHSDVFTTRALKMTLRKVENRTREEGLGFLTKTLPRLAKALDKALAEIEPLDSAKCGFASMPNSKLPRFLGELFKQVLSQDGRVLPNADAYCVRSIREVCGLFYKLETPSDPQLDQNVITKFKRTEEDIRPYHLAFMQIASKQDENGNVPQPGWMPSWMYNVVRGARKSLKNLFRRFDVDAIYPKHGPGAVSTKERLWEKYSWTQIPQRITDEYPLDAYFYASIGHVCDTYQEMNSLDQVNEPYAKVVLVPKDSRGRRLISCEPLAFQWIQQGLGNAIVRHVERHRITRDNVRFTDQQPNRFAALSGSVAGKYATLDLNEASDRVSVGLVNLLFPQPVLNKLMACRSLGTVLPDGSKLTLTKFAPMGSCLCFPVLALTVWSLLDACLETLGATHSERECVYVYGDDVIVPARWAENAMITLESFGLKINRDKSCTKGLFRESCGLDAFKGVDVTPVRIRTVWSSHRSPESYSSYIAYANAMWVRKHYTVYDCIVEKLISLYKEIPSKDIGDYSSTAERPWEQFNSVPSLYYVPEHGRVRRKRINPGLQRPEYRVLTLCPKVRKATLSGWKMLLRYFSEANANYELSRLCRPSPDGEPAPSYYKAFSVREYTCAKRIKLRYAWR